MKRHRTTEKLPSHSAYSNGPPSAVSDRKSNHGQRILHGSLRWNTRRVRSQFAKYQRSGSMQIRDAIFIEYLSLVEFFARQYKGRGVDYDDLFQEGCLGLLAAIEGFDLSRNVEFSTYASPFIQGHIRQYFRDKSWPCSVPRSVKVLALQVRKFSDRMGREPTERELVEQGFIPSDKIVEATAATKVWEPVCFHKAETPGEVNPVIVHAVSVLDKDLECIPDRLTFEHLSETILTSEEAAVIRMYYYEELSQREIAEKLGTYQMMVSRQLHRGICKLAAALTPCKQKKAS